MAINQATGGRSSSGRLAEKTRASGFTGANEIPSGCPPIHPIFARSLFGPPFIGHRSWRPRVSGAAVPGG